MKNIEVIVRQTLGDLQLRQERLLMNTHLTVRHGFSRFRLIPWFANLLTTFKQISAQQTNLKEHT